LRLAFMVLYFEVLFPCVNETEAQCHWITFDLGDK
jgi:hypothetical protein